MTYDYRWSIKWNQECLSLSHVHAEEVDRFIAHFKLYLNSFSHPQSPPTYAMQYVLP